MSNTIYLRNGATARPDEFPPEHMAVLNRNLDTIRDERYTVNEWFERVMSHRAVVTVLTLIAAALFGLAFYNSAAGR